MGRRISYYAHDFHAAVCLWKTDKRNMIPEWSFQKLRGNVTSTLSTANFMNTRSTVIQQQHENKHDPTSSKKCASQLRQSD
jgi:hypothetical protein